MFTIPILKLSRMIMFISLGNDGHMSAMTDKQVGLTTRRKALKTTGALLGGSVVFSGLQGAMAADDPQDWTTTNTVTGVTGIKNTHASTLRLDNSTLEGNVWEHDFSVAGQAVTTENGQTNPDLFSSAMGIEETSSCLELNVGLDEQSRAMWPKPDGGTNNDAVGLINTTIELTADALGNTAVVAVTTAADLVEDFLNTFTSKDLGNPYL
jgi:hypothetical protein